MGARFVFGLFSPTHCSTQVKVSCKKDTLLTSYIAQLYCDPQNQATETKLVGNTDRKDEQDMRHFNTLSEVENSLEIYKRI